MERVGSIMPSYLTLGLWWEFRMEEEEQRKLKATNQKCSGWMRPALFGAALCELTEDFSPLLLFNPLGCDFRHIWRKEQI